MQQICCLQTTTANCNMEEYGRQNFVHIIKLRYEKIGKSNIDPIE